VTSAGLPRPLILASKSPRRLALLKEAGLPVLIMQTGFDDGELVKPADCAVAEWALQLARMKLDAALSHRTLPSFPAEAIILAADTVVDFDGAVMGQPTDASHARTMIHRLSARSHDVVTAAILHDRESGVRTEILDQSKVSVGHIPESEIDRYVATGNWRGKAGGYNLSERVAAGWSISWQGDSATVMGLPMIKLMRSLHNFHGVSPPSRASTG